MTTLKSRFFAAAINGVNRSFFGPICTVFRLVHCESHQARPS